MDYRGQQFSEYLYYFLTIFFGAIAWFVGYFSDDFQITVYGWAVGLGLALILCIPDWPMYNKHPVTWAKKEDSSARKEKKKSDKGGEEGKEGKEREEEEGEG